MSNFNIVIGADVVTTDYPHIIDTPFYIYSQDKAFPDVEWTDFTYPVLNDWAYAMLYHKDKHECKFTVYLMDGPYRLDIYKDKQMKLFIQCINFRNEEITELFIRTDYNAFLSVLHQAIKETMKIMFDINMHRGKYKNVYKQLIIISKELQTAMG